MLRACRLIVRRFLPHAPPTRTIMAPSSLEQQQQRRHRRRPRRRRHLAGSWDEHKRFLSSSAAAAAQGPTDDSCFYFHVQWRSPEYIQYITPDHGSPTPTPHGPIVAIQEPHHDKDQDGSSLAQHVTWSVSLQPLLQALHDIPCGPSNSSSSSNSTGNSTASVVESATTTVLDVITGTSGSQQGSDDRCSMPAGSGVVVHLTIQPRNHNNNHDDDNDENDDVGVDEEDFWFLWRHGPTARQDLWIRRHLATYVSQSHVLEEFLQQPVDAPTEIERATQLFFQHCCDHGHPTNNNTAETCSTKRGEPLLSENDDDNKDKASSMQQGPHSTAMDATTATVATSATESTFPTEEPCLQTDRLTHCYGATEELLWWQCRQGRIPLQDLAKIRRLVLPLTLVVTQQQEPTQAAGPTVEASTTATSPLTPTTTDQNHCSVLRCIQPLEFSLADLFLSDETPMATTQTQPAPNSSSSSSSPSSSTVSTVFVQTLLRTLQLLHQATTYLTHTAPMDDLVQYRELQQLLLTTCKRYKPSGKHPGPRRRGRPKGGGGAGKVALDKDTLVSVENLVYLQDIPLPRQSSSTTTRTTTTTMTGHWTDPSVTRKSYSNERALELEEIKKRRFQLKRKDQQQEQQRRRHQQQQQQQQQESKEGQPTSSKTKRKRPIRAGRFRPAPTLVVPPPSRLTRPQATVLTQEATGMTEDEFLKETVLWHRVNHTFARPFDLVESRPRFGPSRLTRDQVAQLQSLFFTSQGALHPRASRDATRTIRNSYIDFGSSKDDSSPFCGADRRWQIPIQSHVLAGYGTRSSSSSWNGGTTTTTSPLEEGSSTASTRSRAETILHDAGVLDARYERLEELALLIGGTHDQSLHHDIPRDWVTWRPSRPRQEQEAPSQSSRRRKKQASPCPENKRFPRRNRGRSSNNNNKRVTHYQKHFDSDDDNTNVWEEPTDSEDIDSDDSWDMDQVLVQTKKHKFNDKDDDVSSDESETVGWEVNRLEYNRAMMSQHAPMALLLPMTGSYKTTTNNRNDGTATTTDTHDDHDDEEEEEEDSPFVMIGVQKDQIIRCNATASPSTKDDRAFCHVRCGDPTETFEIVRETKHIVVLKVKHGCMFTGDFPHAGVSCLSSNDSKKDELAALANQFWVKVDEILDHSSSKSRKGQRGQVDETNAILNLCQNFSGLNRFSRLYMATEHKHYCLHVPSNAVGYHDCYSNHGD